MPDIEFSWPGQALVNDLGVDAIVAVSPENFAFASGVYLMTAKEVRERLAIAILFPDRPTALMVCSLEEQATRNGCRTEDIRCYTEFADHPVDLLAERLAETPLPTRRIGIDLDYLPASSCDRLRARLPGVELVNTSAEMSALRAVKAGAEAGAVIRAACTTHRSVLDALAASRCGDTERELCLRIADGMLRGGADTTHFLFLGSGPRSGMIHVTGNDRRVEEGDIIHLDVGALFDGYSSDFARTYSAGAPTVRQQQYYQAIRQTQQAVIEALQPDMLAEDVYYLCRDEMHGRGLELRIPLVGHSLGLEIHERPILRPGEKIPLAPGMLLNIEPAVWDEDNNLYHLEDLVEITDRGAELRTLGYAPASLPVIGREP